MHYVYLLRSVSDGGVAASTQNQALSALLFLYKEVLKQELGWLKNVERAKKPARLPVALTREEARKVFSTCTALRGSWPGCCMAADSD